MKWIFALLLTANIALFAVMQLPHGRTGSEPMTEHPPLHAERIRLISDDEAQHQPETPPTTSPPSARTCMEWGPLAEEDLSRAQNILKDIQLESGNVAVHRLQGKSNSYWVFIPPLKSRQDANRKVEELKGMGIDESFVIQDNNKWRYAVSLGIFSSEEGATKYLLQMRAKGVKSAKAAPRNPDGGQATITIRGVDDDQIANLEKLTADFSGSALKSVKCDP